MKLYYTPGACSLAPHISLIEAGLDYELVKVDLATKTLEDGSNYLDICSKGYIPALALEDGSLLTEGAVIQQYITDHSKGTELGPKNGTMERYRFHERLHFIATELHKGYAPFFNPATPDAYKDIAWKKLQDRYAYVDSYLAQNEYFMGDTYNATDNYLFNVTLWAGLHKLDLTPYTHVTAFMDKMFQRESVKKTFFEEGLTLPEQAAA